MAVEKARVIARIKALFPKATLSKQRMDAIADKLSEKPEDDADDAAIDQVVQDFNDNSVLSLEELARQDDRIRTLAKKTVDPDRKPAPAKGEESKGQDDDDPMAIMLNEIRGLKSEITELKAEGSRKSLEERFKSDKRLEGIPAAMLKGRVPQDEDSFETAIEELAADWKEISGTVASEKEKGKLSLFGKDVPPSSGGGGGTPKQVSKEVTDAMAKRLL